MFCKIWNMEVSCKCWPRGGDGATILLAYLFTYCYHCFNCCHHCQWHHYYHCYHWHLHLHFWHQYFHYNAAFTVDIYSAENIWKTCKIICEILCSCYMLKLKLTLTLLPLLPLLTLLDYFNWSTESLVNLSGACGW